MGTRTPHKHIERMSFDMPTEHSSTKATNSISKIATCCKTCGRVVWHSPYQISVGLGIYCSRDCMKKPKIPLLCENCGVRFYKHESALVKEAGRFCSSKCWKTRLDNTFIQRFWARVDKSGECWNWTASKDTYDYGHVSIHGKLRGTHKISWELANGPITKGSHVLHTCDNPPCVQVCPAQATYRRDDGIVVQNFRRCIGCKYCIIACPYGVRSFNYKDPSEQGYDRPDLPPDRADKGVWPYPHRVHGVVEKCTFCFHRIDQATREGKKVGEDIVPACAEACPARAIDFGDLDDPESKVSQLLATRQSFRLRESMDTQPKVFYLPR